MKFIHAAAIVLLMCCAFLSKAQTIRFAQDLNHAAKLAVNKQYSFPVSPAGFGEWQEFPIHSYKSPFYFEKERNTAWFLLEMPADGIFTFEIIPHKIQDDYDWMLF